MMRSLITLAVLAIFPAAAQSQDMPLSQILIDGEGWKKVPAATRPVESGISLPGTSNSRGQNATCYSVTSDYSTLYVGYLDSTAVIAFNLDEKKQPHNAAAYCPLRLPHGAKGIDVTGLTIDRDGRIYAATHVGVQVYDPTGRLCGVLTPAAKGKPEHLVFEDDRLTLWIGDTKYARTLNTRGAK